MSRVDRLELIVRHLADRILGEAITFDQIAETEAAEQGVAYVPPAAQGPDIEGALSPLLDRISALERRPATISGEFPDLMPAIEAIEHLANRVAALEQADIRTELDGKISALAKHLMDQERSIQAILSATIPIYEKAG